MPLYEYNENNEKRLLPYAKLTDQLLYKITFPQNLITY